MWTGPVSSKQKNSTWIDALFRKPSFAKILSEQSETCHCEIRISLQTIWIDILQNLKPWWQLAVIVAFLDPLRSALLNTPLTWRYSNSLPHCSAIFNSIRFTKYIRHLSYTKVYMKYFDTSYHSLFISRFFSTNIIIL